MTAHHQLLCSVGVCRLQLPWHVRKCVMTSLSVSSLTVDEWTTDISTSTVVTMCHNITPVQLLPVVHGMCNVN